MSEKNIVLIPGDGIGTEIIAAAKAVCDVAFEKANVKVNWIDKKAGGASIDAYGVPLTEDTIEACKDADAAYLRGGDRCAAVRHRPADDHQP